MEKKVSNNSHRGCGWWQKKLFCRLNVSWEQLFMYYQEIMCACAYAVELYRAAIKLKPLQYSCLWKSVFDRAILLVEAVTVLS